MRVKLKDIRQGKTFWHVRIRYSPDGQVFSRVRKIFITGHPFPASPTNTLFVRWCTAISADYPTKECISLRDSNVLKNNYNLTGLFTSKKSADQYAARIRSGCLSEEESRIAGILKRRPVGCCMGMDWLGGV